MPLPARIRQWWSFFGTSAAHRGVDPYWLAAICDRESLGGAALEPSGPGGKGDKGHGLGLMQIDDRAHPDFATATLPDGTPAWMDPGTNIEKGAEVFGRAFNSFATYPTRTRLAAAIAAYNAGVSDVNRALNDLTRPASYEAELQACDAVTTGDNYVSDVLGRIERFRAPAPPSSPPPKPPESA